MPMVPPDSSRPGFSVASYVSGVAKVFTCTIPVCMLREYKPSRIKGFTQISISYYHTTLAKHELFISLFLATSFSVTSPCLTYAKVYEYGL